MNLFLGFLFGSLLTSLAWGYVLLRVRAEIQERRETASSGSRNISSTR